MIGFFRYAETRFRMPTSLTCVPDHVNSLLKKISPFAVEVVVDGEAGDAERLRDDLGRLAVLEGTALLEEPDGTLLVGARQRLEVAAELGSGLREQALE